MKHKMFSLALAVGVIMGMLFGITAPFVTSAEVDDEQRSIPVDSLVLDEIQTTGSASNWNNFRSEAELSAAKNLSWSERGWYVFDELSTDNTESRPSKLLNLDTSTVTNHAQLHINNENVISSDTSILDVNSLSMGLLPIGSINDTITEEGSTPLATSIVYGYVYDGGIPDVGSHGYPLYSAIHITATGFDQTVYADPITGYYQISLQSGTEYTFTTTPVIGGYESLQEQVIPTGTTYSHNIYPSVLSVECAAPGYELVYKAGTRGWGCELVTGGVVAGYVYDNNFDSPLDNAEITGDEGSTHSFSIPGDPANAGFYWIFQPIKIYNVFLPLISSNSGSGSMAKSNGSVQNFSVDLEYTASKELYLSSTEAVRVELNEITQLDFCLQAGLLDFSPNTLDVIMFVNDPVYEETLYIDNLGGADASFALVETPEANWLLLDPTSGNIPMYDSEGISITFDPAGAGLGQGDYVAELVVNHNTPYTYPNIVITLHFYTSGIFNGNVTGLERCDINPAPLSGARINFWRNGFIAYTTTTDANGYYSMKVRDGVYDIEVVRSSYVSQMMEDVSLPIDAVVTTDFELRLNAPCLTVIPTQLEQTQPVNTITTQMLTLENSGAAPLNFYLSEIEHGIIPPDSLILDPSFEFFDPEIPDNFYWDEYSYEATTPLCTEDTCGNGGATGPRTGFVWSWFGGLLGGDEGYLSQQVVIPSGDTYMMTFFVEQYSCGSSGASNYLALKIDGNEIWRTDGLDPACGALGYREVELDLTAYADDLLHEIKFYSETVDHGGFFIDDVELNADVVVDISWLSEDFMRGTVLPDTSLDVTITYNSYGLTTGNYLAQLWLRQYPYPSILIPVTLHISD